MSRNKTLESGLGGCAQLFRSCRACGALQAVDEVPRDLESQEVLEACRLQALEVMSPARGNPTKIAQVVRTWCWSFRLAPGGKAAAADCSAVLL